MYASLIEANSEKITESGCWIWMCSVGSHGYGDFRRNNMHMLAHRASYNSFIGPVPAGMFVLHRCDNRLCVNPHHLYLGTNTDNMQDKVRKGRWAGQGPHKLTLADVREIRQRRARGESLKALATAYDMHSDHIRKITN